MNKRRKKALVLSSLLSLSILCGCGSESKTVNTNETIEIDGETYIKSGGEYNKIEVVDRTFEPGEHIIHYVDIPVEKKRTITDANINQGFDNAAFYMDEIPEGYKLIGVTSYSNDNGFSNFIVYIFVNEVTVIAKGRYDVYTNEIVYETPGKVVEESSLTLEP
ncbi:MAG: hypothetical protein IKR57_04370 [Bacilli bacterium]|nr:hypothetical protein [Bacilli bacterium]